MFGFFGVLGLVAGSSLFCPLVFFSIRKFEKAVAVSWVCSGGLEENSGKAAPSVIGGELQKSQELWKTRGITRPATVAIPGLQVGGHDRDDLAV